jgi:hypothetical protein
VLVAINLSFYWGLRPQVFSFTFFAIVVALSERFLDRETIQQMTRPAFVTLAAVFAVLFALWANSHGGFVAGICVFNLLVFCRAIEAYCKDRDRRTILRCVILIAACSLATLLNPYGYDLHLWLIESLRVPRPEVTEWHSPNLLADGAQKIWAIFGLTLVGFVCTKEKRDWAKIAVYTVVVVQAFTHQRHLPFVAILFGFWLPQHLSSASTRIRVELPSRKRSLYDTPWFAIGPLAALCLTLGYQVGSRLLSIEVPFDRYPIAALQFMSDHEIDDSIVVTGEWAQYVLAVAGARTRADAGCRVAFDGRFRTCYPQTIVDMHFDFFRGDAPKHLRYRSPESPPPDPHRVLEFRGPNLVLLKTTEEFASGIMRTSDQWCLLYNDRTAELWGRSQFYGQHVAKDHFVTTPRVDASKLAASSIGRASLEWPAKPIRHRAATAFVSQSGGGTEHD